jgi:hypothetical protein
MKRFTLFFILAVVLSACSTQNATPVHDSCRGVEGLCYDYTVDESVGCIVEETYLYSCSTGCEAVKGLPIGTPVNAVCQANGWCLDLYLGGYLEKEYVGSCEQ